MAKISRSLDDIEKLVKKAHQTPKERLKEINQELAKLNSKKGVKDLKYYRIIDGQAQEEEQKKDANRIQTLEEARKILIEEIEKEEDKSELNRRKKEKAVIKDIQEEIKGELFNNINAYFEEYPPEYHKKIFEILHLQEVIKEESQKIINIYGADFKSFILSIYIKTINQVYAIYSYNVKQLEEQKKAEEKQKKERQKIAAYKLKRSIIADVSIVALLKHCNKRKKR